MVIDGRCTTLTGLSDFVANLEASGYFKRSIEIVRHADRADAAAAGGELIKFTIKAHLPAARRGAPSRPPRPRRVDSAGGQRGQANLKVVRGRPDTAQ